MGSVYIKREWEQNISGGHEGQYISRSGEQHISRESGSSIYQGGEGTIHIKREWGALYIKEERGGHLISSSGEQYISRRSGGAFNIKQWGAVYIKEWVAIYIKRE